MGRRGGRGGGDGSTYGLITTPWTRPVNRHGTVCTDRHKRRNADKGNANGDAEKRLPLTSLSLC